MGKNSLEITTLSAFVVAQAADVGTTILALDKYGGYEQRALARAIIGTDHVGPIGFEGMGEYVLNPLFKIVFLPMVATIILACTRNEKIKQVELAGLWGFTASTAYAAIHNALQII